jgi:uncharacterized protein (DUF433 family)
MSEDYIIISDPQICGGKPVIKGTRVPVQYILELWGRGYSVESIHEQYPTVSKEQITKAVKLLKEDRLIKILH